MKHNKNQQSFELFDCSLLNQLIRKREKKSEFVNFIKDFFGNNIYQNKKAKPQMCTHNSNAHVLDKEYYTARSCSERHCLFRVILMPSIMNLSFLATEIRSIGQFHSTFAVMSTDFDLSMQIQSSRAKLWKLRVNMDWELFFLFTRKLFNIHHAGFSAKFIFIVQLVYVFEYIYSNRVRLIDIRKKLRHTYMYRMYN